MVIVQMEFSLPTWPKTYMGHPWVIIYEHRAIVCAYVYGVSLNKQTNILQF